MVTLIGVLQILVGALLLVPNLSYGATFFAFYLNGSSYVVTLFIFGWGNIILQRTGDDALRSITLYCMNIGSMTLYTFWGIVFYSAEDAPYWKKGSITLIVSMGVMLSYMWVIWKVCFLLIRRPTIFLAILTRAPFRSIGTP
jgi:MFS transporter, ACS family, pantothenate transporter